MKFKLTELKETEFETESLKEILDKFYDNCSWHLTVELKDKDWNTIILWLEINDMESNIMFETEEWETERTSYSDYEDTLSDIEDEWLDINSLTLI